MPRPNLYYTALGMTKTLYRIVCLATFALVATSANAVAKWEVEKSIDPITDETIYHAWTFGSELSNRNGSYCPKLAVRIMPTKFDGSPRRFLFTPDVFIWSPGIKRKTEAASISMIMRFDKEPPTSSTWTGSNNKCTLFCDDPTNTIRRIARSQNLALRFTLKNHELTTTFDTSGLSSALASIKADYLGRIGKHKEAQSKKTPSVGQTVPIGHNRTLKNQILNQVSASLAGEYDAQINGYYEDAKNWLKSKRINRENQ